MKRRITSTLLAALILLSAAVIPAIATPVPDYTVHSAYMFGDQDGNFRPGASVSRGEIAAILVRTYVSDYQPNTLPPGMTAFDVFPYDVHAGAWYYHYIAWGYYAGLITGSQITEEFPIRRYRPNDPITRRELATLLVRASGHELIHPSPTFNQIPDLYPDGAWAVSYIYTAWRHGLLRGDQHGNMRPIAHLTRAEAAVAMNRLLGRLDGSVPMRDITIINHVPTRVFADVTDGWYAAPVLAATNNHAVRQDWDSVVIRILG